MDFITGYVLGSRMLGKRIGMAASADSFALSLSSEADKLADRVQRLSLVTEALWALLEENGYTRQQLIAKIEEIDRADGSVDGQVIRPPLRCPSCDSAVSVGAMLCQFCGWENPDVDPLAAF
jgi:hypothetical protein